MHPHDGDTGDGMIKDALEDIYYKGIELLVFPIDFVLMLPMNLEERKFIKKVDKFLYNLRELGYDVTEINASKFQKRYWSDNEPLEVINRHFSDKPLLSITLNGSSNLTFDFVYNDIHKHSYIENELKFMNFIDALIMDLGDNRQQKDRELAQDLEYACQN